jgi:hypothetical protein
MVRRAAQISEIKLTDEEIAFWESVLIPYYIETGRHSEENAKAIVGNKLQEVQFGWARAPHNVEQRIQRKTGFVLDKKAKPPTPSINISTKTKNPTSYSNIYDALPEHERTWWDTRLKTYVDEFEFNQSSDIPMIEQILVEELIQKRLSIKQLLASNVDPMTSKVMTESSKRMLELQAKLGITREQRAKELNNIDGNIASVAIEFEAKMAEILKEEAALDAAAAQFQADKELEAPINILPPEDKLLSILGIDDSNEDSMLLGEINMDNLNKVVEEIQKGTAEVASASSSD